MWRRPSGITWGNLAVEKLSGCYELSVGTTKFSDRGIQIFPLVEKWDPGLFCSVPLETENSEKESTPTFSKISKTPDLEKSELPFLLGKQEFVDRNPWSENRLDRNESEQTVCAYELLLFETLLWRLGEPLSSRMGVFEIGILYWEGGAIGMWKYASMRSRLVVHIPGWIQDLMERLVSI